VSWHISVVDAAASPSQLKSVSAGQDPEGFGQAIFFLRVTSIRGSVAVAHPDQPVGAAPLLFELERAENIAPGPWC